MTSHCTDHLFTHYSVGLYSQEVIDMYQLAFLEVFDTDHSIEIVHKTIYFEKLREESIY